MKVAINKIKALGHGFELISVGRHTLVKSVPQELNTDKSKVLEFAQSTGYVSKPFLINSGWTEHRINNTLEVHFSACIMRQQRSAQDLLKDGLAMIDDGAPDGVRLYWFPCVRDIAV